MKKKIIKLLEQVFDPEIPVLSILDLGIFRDISITSNQIEIIITPTYSGCPATKVFEEDIIAVLTKNGYKNIKVTQQLAPAWTTDWLTENGKKKLKKYGIAPPVESTSDTSFLFGDEKTVPCPRCDSTNTKLISQFGSTACKSLYKCDSCLEPFDYFKCH